MFDSDSEEECPFQLQVNDNVDQSAFAFVECNFLALLTPPMN